MNRVTDTLLRTWQSGTKPLVEVSGSTLSLTSIIVFLFIIILSYYASKMTNRSINRILINKPIDRGLKAATERISGYLVFFLGILLALDLLGVNLKSIAAFSALIIIGLGFAFQSIIQNFIAGLILLVERPIKKGDMVRVNETFGRVLDIGFRSTVLLTRDDVAIIIPNSELVTMQVINESLSGDQLRLSFHIRTHFTEDPERVKELLLAVINEHDQVLKEPQPSVFLNEFGEYAVDYKIVFWTRELWRREAVLSDLRSKAFAILRSHSISIPVPRRDITVNTTSSLDQPRS